MPPTQGLVHGDVFAIQCIDIGAWIAKRIDESVVFMFDEFIFGTDALCQFFERVAMKF